MNDATPIVRVLSTGDALLAAVLAAPDDDGPRLIYADWLDDHGEPERAELIRIQCGLFPDRQFHFETTADQWCRCCLLHTAGRGYRLLHQNGRQTIFARLPRPLWCPSRGEHDAGSAGEFDGVRFRRGFLEAVSMTAAEWLAHGDAILAEHPVTEVRLTTHAVWEGVEVPASESPSRTGRYFKVRLQGRQRLHVAKIAANEQEEELLRAEWPSVHTWHLPLTEAVQAAAATIQRLVPAAEESGPSAAAPDRPRRPGHSRMPGWLADQRARPGRR